MTASNRMNVGTRTARAQSLIDNNNNNNNPTCEHLPFFIAIYFNFVSFFSKFSKERCSNNIISISFTIYFGF